MKNIEQYKAADPAQSVWVAASAGTGKTKVLTDRVLRLLLAGAPFDKILCLTFTNAAASEMTNRISKSLLEWQNSEKREGLLEELLGRSPTETEIAMAAGLFKDLMLSPEQLNIHTIHSFCQKILQRFPFEAGLSPGFKVLGEMETQELCDKVIEDLANSDNDSLNYVLSCTHELTFNDIIMEILTSQIYFRDLFHNYSSKEEYIKYLKHETNVSHHEDFYIADFASNVTEVFDPDLVDVERSLIERYNAYAALPLDEKIRRFSQFELVLCTMTGEPRKTLLMKKSRVKNPGMEDSLRSTQAALFECSQKVKIARMIVATGHMFEIAQNVIAKYADYKKSKGCLDYDDLIYYTKELLTNSAVKDWVLYKLDGGVMHLLVDEAQDTSPGQWQIIDSIMQEFYSGEGASKDDRTVFIVGDEKQSIYSFQGADVSNFMRVNSYIKEQMKQVNKSYQNIDLEWSYRSSSAVLDVVGTILERNAIHFGLAPPNLKCFRDQHNGTVELWPLYKDKKGPEDLFWPLVDDYKTDEWAGSLLARDIAQFIKNYIGSGTILPSTGQPAAPRDFMILIRRRNEFTHEIINALKIAGVEVGGIDRMMIMEHLSVLDIISAAKFALLPEDDLNLACLLKSPIFGLSDKELEEIALGREGSLFASIKDQRLLDPLEFFLKIGVELNISDFFFKLIDVISLREVLRSVNGESSDDALDELINLAFQFEKQHSGNLQEFIYWIERGEVEIKRDVSSSSGVRVMTVHAAKGLESPVVILADTTSLPTKHGNFFWKEGHLLWLGSAKNMNHIYSSYKDALAEKDYQEYLRLLYVALTRAEDHLVVAGFLGQDKVPEGCWHSLVEDAIRSMEHEEHEKIIYHACARMFSTPYGKNVIAEQSLAKADFNWDTAHLLHEKMDETAQAISPLDSRMGINYGLILHKILEDSVKTRNFVFQPSHPFIESLPTHLKAPVREKLSELFLMKEFTDLMSYDKLKTETSIGYMESGKAKIGRIDLLAISDKEVWIIDYKTDKKPAKSVEKLDPSYIAQLKFYTDAMKKIMPDHSVNAKILWLENLEFMDI